MTKVNPIRDGFHSVTPYLIVDGADRLIDFMKRAFGAEEVSRSMAPDGRVMNVAVRIGDSMVEVGEPRDPWKPMPAAVHLYLSDADAAYERALEAGATSLYEPADMPYGERGGGVEDPCGNYWFPSTYTGRVRDDAGPA